MHSVQFEIVKPTDDSAFEDMCARIYGELFRDPMPKINGRRGQAQGGVDVFVNSHTGRLGIQSKRYVDGALTLKMVEKELERAEKKKVPIVKLIVATTAAADAALLHNVQNLSDTRVAAGQFPVEIEFWDDICRHIRGNGKLLRDYAPNAPGAMFQEQRESNLALQTTALRIESKLDGAIGLPSARSDSVNKFISDQLDGINDLLKSCRFRDGLEAVTRLGSDMSVLDPHQQARWYLQRALCTWHLEVEGGRAAVADFLKAAELYPDDEKMAAAGVRGLLLKDDVAGAVAAGATAVGRFPTSAHVWIAYTNARMLNGGDIKLADVPSAMRSNCDVLQILAWARKMVGDLAGANHVIGQALDLPDAGFFVRRTALAMALEVATADPIQSAFELRPGANLDALRRAIFHLTPRKDRLWDVQSTEARADTLVHLAYAYNLAGQSEEALKLVEEARHADALSPKLQRVALDAYRRLDRLDEILVNGRAWLDQLEEDALILVTEVASDAGDVALVEAVVAAIQKVPCSEPKVFDIMQAMRWIALWRSKDGRAQSTAEVKAVNWATSDSLPLICGGARILHLAGENVECDIAVARAKEIVPDLSQGPAALQLADLYYAVHKHAEAARIYERFAPLGHRTELHVRLLVCYVRSGARKKARELLTSLPGDWAADDQVRGLALELGQQAADWDFLVPLADRQCESAPKSSGGWLLRLVLDLKTKKMLRFHQDLEALPDELNGHHRQIAQLASLELKYDRQESGMLRLYRQFRRNMDALEAASGYFVGIVACRVKLPNMDESLLAVVPGSTVQLQDAFGGALTISLDPTNSGALPSRDGFYPHDSQEVQALLGAALGAEVELPGGLGTTRKYTIQSITSAYRHLLQVAQKRVQTSMSSDSAFFSVPVPTGEDGADFSHVHEVLKRQSAYSKMVMDAYQNGPLTLGIVARMLGRSVVDVVTGWPNSGPKLFVSPGIAEERQSSAQLLERPDAAYVVDAATIAELTRIGCQRALAILPKVYCSTKTLEVMEVCLEEAQTVGESGSLLDDEGQMRFIKYSDRDKERRVAFLQSMVEAVRAYCEVVPAYGPDTLPDGLEKAEEVLEAEEYSAMLLVAERDATLLTVDGRLAQLAAATLQRFWVWPQVLLMHAGSKGVIGPRDYSQAVLQQFLGNRTFVSLAAYDLLWMALQGGFTLRYGIQQFKEYLASPGTEFFSGARVALEFLNLLASHRSQVKAFAELLGHLVEGALRHPSADAEWFLAEVADLTAQLVVSTAGPESHYPPLEALREARLKALGNVLAQAVQAGLELTARPDQGRAVKLDALKCTVAPHLVFDGNVPELESAVIAQVEPARPPEASGLQASPSEMQTVYVVQEATAEEVVVQTPAAAPDLVARTSQPTPIKPAGA
jgi:tetratricopeptide (TPR) repeat protein